MRLVKLGAAAVNQTPLDWAGNRDRITAAIAEARRQQVSILCLPELCITGYNCEDAFHAPGLQRTALDVLAELAPHSAGMAVAVGLPLLFQKALYNTCCLLVDGRIAGFKVPRYWKFVDAFPLTVTGKVQKFRMRELAVDELGLAAAVETA